MFHANQQVSQKKSGIAVIRFIEPVDDGDSPGPNVFDGWLFLSMYLTLTLGGEVMVSRSENLQAYLFSVPLGFLPPAANSG